mgnify:CR=1 FL=1
MKPAKVVTDSDDGAGSGDGFFGGGHIGLNRQNGNVVFGIEADINFGELDLGSASASSFALQQGDEPDFSAGSTRASADVDWYGTVRARLGLAHGPLLAYVTGGLAFGEVKLNGDVSLASGFDFDDDKFKDLRSPKASFSDSSREIGWTLGAGVDYMVKSNVIIGISYQYVDLGSVSGGADLTEIRRLGPTINGEKAFSDVAKVGGKAEVDAAFHTVQARISFKLGHDSHEPLK